MQELREQISVSSITTPDRPEAGLGMLSQAMAKFGIAEISRASAVMHKIATREAALNQLHPLMRRFVLVPWVEQNMARIAARAQHIVKLVILSIMLCLVLGIPAVGILMENSSYGAMDLAVLGAMSIIASAIVWLTLESVWTATAVSWTESQPWQNNDIPERGRQLTTLLATELGNDFQPVVHRLGPDPLLEGRFRGESRFYYGWDSGYEFVEINGKLCKVPIRE